MLGAQTRGRVCRATQVVEVAATARGSEPAEYVAAMQQLDAGPAVRSARGDESSPTPSGWHMPAPAARWARELEDDAARRPRTTTTVLRTVAPGSPPAANGIRGSPRPGPAGKRRARASASTWAAATNYTRHDSAVSPRAHARRPCSDGARSRRHRKRRTVPGAGFGPLHPTGCRPRNADRVGRRPTIRRTRSSQEPCNTWG